MTWAQLEHAVHSTVTAGQAREGQQYQRPRPECNTRSKESKEPSQQGLEESGSDICVPVP